MKLLDIKTLEPLPFDMDAECIDLCNILNTLPGITTFESCCGHYRNRYNIWFFCNNIDTLSRLGKATERNYSDNKWEVVVDSTDTTPYGVFWLRSKEPFKTPDEMNESVQNLIKNIQHWFDDRFDNYFLGHQSIENTKPHWIDVKNLPDAGMEVITVCRNKNKEDGIWLYDLCYWTGKEFEGRTNWEDVVKWIPSDDLERILD